MTDTAAIFIETPDNPPPDRLSGGFVTTPAGLRLRHAIARPGGPSRGTVLVLPGRNEAVEKYFETMADLTARGFTALVFDWRGQGGSQRMLRDPAKGHIDSIATYVKDLETVFQRVALHDCPRPYTIMAHSLGGLVALAAIPALTNHIERMVLSAPLVALPDRGVASHILPHLAGALRRAGLGRLAVRRLKRTGADWNLHTNPLTADPRRFARNRRLAETAPQLGVSALTAGWVHATCRAMRRLQSSDVIAGLHLPTLIVTAGADTVVSSPAAERLAWRMRSGHFLCIAGARHEILQEKDEFREQFLAAFEGFVESTMPPVQTLAVAEAQAATAG